MDIDGDQEDGESIFPHKKQYDISLNNKIMVGAIASLSLVISLVLILYIYARFSARNRSRRDAHQGHQSPLDQPKTGLDPMVLASLPTFIIKDQGSDKKSTECAVCLCALEAGKIARLLPNCNHIFHVECIDKWLSSQSNCPICRAEVCLP